MPKYNCSQCGKPMYFEGVCWECRARQHRKEVASWTEHEILEKKQQVIDRLRQSTNDNFFKSDELDLFHDLLSIGVDCHELAEVALAKEIYYPSELYYKASAEVRDQLIDKLMTTEYEGNGSLYLSCLAMVGDSESQNALYQLKLHPRPWRAKLYVDSDIYAEGGGWTFDENNQRIELNYETCYAFVKDAKYLKGENSSKHTSENTSANSTESTSETEAKEQAQEPLSIAGQGAIVARTRDEVCPCCGCRLVDMLIIDGRDERFKFLGINGLISATCCPNCVAMTDGISSHFELDGRINLLEFEGETENFYQNEDLEEMSNNHLILASEAKPVFYGAFSTDLNTIGGFASWVQDWEYKTCPKCGKKMKYLAQIHWDTIDNGTEGTLFIELCPECHITTIFHQQT